MAARRANLILAVIPSGLFCLGLFLTRAHGPFYFRNNFDPEYCYLLNSLNLLTFHAPRHTDHPGTTLQLIGAAVVWLQWLFSLRAHGQTLSESALSQPEQYLRTINLVLNVLVAGTLFWAGRSVYRLSKSLPAAMLLQLTVLFYHETVLALTRVSPEPLLMAASLALMVPLMPMVLGGETTEANENRLAVWAGVLLGFGLITKITFVPWAAVILLFPKKSFKARFGAAAGGTAIILLIPVMVRLRAMAHWFSSLLMHSGRYGKGSVGIPAAGAMRTAFLALWRAESPLFLLLALYCVGLLCLFVFEWKGTLDTKRLARLLLVACVAIISQTLMVMKHPSPGARYLLPGLMLTVFVNSVSYGIVRQSALLTTAVGDCVLYSRQRSLR
jgi:hypothetical protein